jgi:hypothetical protein
MAHTWVCPLQLYKVHIFKRNKNYYAFSVKSKRVQIAFLSSATII